MIGSQVFGSLERGWNVPVVEQTCRANYTSAVGAPRIGLARLLTISLGDKSILLHKVSVSIGFYTYTTTNTFTLQPIGSASSFWRSDIKNK